jgi:hypothetical protein
MADKHIADGESTFKAIASGPDACRVGNQVVPFESMQTLNKQKLYNPHTKARGEPILTVGSVIGGTQSNAGQGVVSGTALGSGDVIVTSGSPTVKANSQPIARHLSDVAMNNANAAGKLYTQEVAPNAPIEDNRTPCNNPPKTSPQLERLKADVAKVKANPLNAHQLDEYVRFEQTSKGLGDAINQIRPDAGGSGIVSGAAGVTRGVLGFLKDGVLGIGQLAYAVAKRASPATRLQDQLEMAMLAENIRLGNVCVEQVQQQAKAMGKELAKPVTDAWGRGDYAEAVTRGGVELATILLPIAKAGLAGKAGKTGEVAEATTAAERMSEAAKAVEVKKSPVEAPTEPPKKPPPEATDGVHIKAAYGEGVAHDKMLAKGFEPVGKTNGEYRAGQQGIDGVYKPKNPPPDYVITEAKYGSSTLGKTADGKQMSNTWLKGGDRLIDKVGEAEARAIEKAMEKGTVEKWLINVKADGSSTMVKLDEFANKIGKAVPF